VPVGTIIVGGGVALVAAEVATWCFKAAAQDQRQIRRDVARQERQGRADIEWDTQRRLAQEAYEQRGAWLDMLSECMDSVWDVRKRTRSLRSQFQEAIRGNQSILKDSPLTFPQQEAIRDCIFHLERGVARLDAYSGPYLQQFIEDIKNCKSAAFQDSFIEPDMPESCLPDEFPVVGDNLRLSKEETRVLRQSGQVGLGHGQAGRFQPSYPWTDESEQVDVFVDGLDRDTSTWMLSPAKGVVASLTHGTFSPPLEANLLTHNRGGCEAVWHSPFGESLELFLPFSLADSFVRSAPWGTCLPLYLHNTDYRTSRITVGQTMPAVPDESGLSILILPNSDTTVSAIKKAREISSHTFWLRDSKDDAVLLRLASGEEFAVTPDERTGVLRICEQVGLRLGNVDGDICKSNISLCVQGIDQPGAEVITGTEFIARIAERLDEQDELRSIFQEEVLETGKYQLLLEAEMQASNARERISVGFSRYSTSNRSGSEQVTFTVSKGDLSSVDTQMAVEVIASPKTLHGYVRKIDNEGRQVDCVFAPDDHKAFRHKKIEAVGMMYCCRIDPDLRRQVKALEQFRNVKFLQSRSTEEREAFRLLRRTLLGLPTRQEIADNEHVIDVHDFERLNPHQQSAVRLINSNSPLTLVLGPPGTGKTDTIAIAIEAFLRKHPTARVAIVSQANVAVDEALHKLKSRYPSCDIVRHVSAHGLESLPASSKEITQHRLREDFLSSLCQQTATSPEAAELRERFRFECQDEVFVTHRIVKALTESASVYGCTLSMLGRLSFGAALFDLVVVDEAAKASLPECMIAAIAAKRLVLVGDHHQLLPFLDESILDRAGDNRNAKREIEELWNNSLFKRIWDSAQSDIKTLLQTHYRSRSAIREAISHLFYKGNLLAGRSDESDRVPYPSSLVWVDTLKLRSHRRAGKSLVNDDEAQCIHSILKMLSDSLPDSRKVSVAIICFYGEQKVMVEEVLRDSSVLQRFATCEARTVDASQGGQWDVVLLALTRCNGNTSFVGNANRLNVALSRAKELAVIVGNFQFALKDNHPDSRLGDFARYVRANAANGIRICAPAVDGSVAPAFGMNRHARQQRRSNARGRRKS
jgi:hypothetical protein